jgi:hypothetical protein
VGADVDCLEEWSEEASMVDDGESREFERGG